MVTALCRPWPLPPSILTLSSDEVHVWRASLDLPAARAQNLEHNLTADELSEAVQFRFQKDRQHFIVARALLREILGRYLDVEPGQLCFCANEHGKPYLVSTPGQQTLGFNLSHSDGLALYAITCGRQVGIDLERVRPIAEAEQIVARFFSTQENAVFQALPASLKQEAFFACWTRKEAYIKAIGEGLSLPLDRFDVSADLGEPAALLRIGEHQGEATRWSLLDLAPGAGYVAALAVEGDGWRLHCWQFPQPDQYAGTRSVRVAPPRS